MKKIFLLLLLIMESISINAQYYGDVSYVDTAVVDETLPDGFTYYSKEDNRYDAVYRVDDMLPEEIKAYNTLIANDSSIEVATAMINTARAWKNLKAAPPTIIEMYYLGNITPEDSLSSEYNGAQNIGFWLVNSTPVTIKKITITVSFYNERDEQVYDTKTGGKYCVLTFNNLIGRSTKDDYQDIFHNINNCLHNLKLAKASNKQLFYNRSAASAAIEKVDILYENGKRTNKVSLFDRGDTGKYGLSIDGPTAPFDYFLFNWSKVNKKNEPTEKPSSNTTNNMTPDVMPSFPGGNGALMSWLGRNISYPAQAAEHNIEGRVLVAFLVNEDGSISNVHVAKSVEPSLDEEAVNVVSRMPRWTPGKLNGKPIAVDYFVPVTFRLKK